MTTISIWIYFVFIFLIIVTIVLQKKPILVGALGLLAVGVIEKKSFFTGIQVAFRALLHTATDFLPIILLIGLVVGMTKMLKDTGTDKLIIKPLLKLKSPFLIYWGLGLVLWGLTLFLWPTPAVSLMGALILSVLANTKISHLGMAVGLCVFGEGIGLSGDFIIQGAPELLGKAANIEVASIIKASLPVVLGSGLAAAFVGYWRMLKMNRLLETPKEEMGTEKNSVKKVYNNQAVKQKRNNSLLAVLVATLYFLAVIWLLTAGIRGDDAAAATGGVTILVIIAGTLINDYRTSLNTFGKYIQEGMRFSMGVFAPIVVIAGFFLLGTAAGTEKILVKTGPGYLEQLALGLSAIIALNKLTCLIIVIIVAVLGAMSGSGFSALPLVGGTAAALGQAAGQPIVSLAVLGQIVAIWTDATIIPWGNPAVVSAVTNTETGNVVRQNVFCWLAAIVFASIWTFNTM